MEESLLIARDSRAADMPAPEDVAGRVSPDELDIRSSPSILGFSLLSAIRSGTPLKFAVTRARTIRASLPISLPDCWCVETPRARCGVFRATKIQRAYNQSNTKIFSKTPSDSAQSPNISIV
jgi:hypothetical protein